MTESDGPPEEVAGGDVLRVGPDHPHSRRMGWLATVAEVNRRLTGGIGEEPVAEALAILGRSADADRVSIFEITQGASPGVRLSSQRYEWARGEVEAQIDNPTLQGMPAEEMFPGWLDILDAGAPVAGLTRDFPQSVRKVLEPQSVVSILVVPIRIDGALWGTIGFDDCSRDRRWDEGEVEMLSAVGAAAGAAILRRRSEREVLELQQRIEFLLGSTGTGLDIIDAGHNIRFVDKAWADKLGPFQGQKCYRYFFGDDAPHEGCGVTMAIGARRVVRTERSLPKEGGRIIEVVSVPFQNGDGEWLAAEINIDITERKATRRAVEDHRALQAGLAAVRDASLGEDEGALIRTFLEALVREYGFRMAWYGRFAGGAVRPVLWAGQADRYLDGLVLEIRDPEHPDTQCAMSRAILSGQPFGYADLMNDEGFRRWRDYALELGYRSNLAIPVEVEGRTEGGVMVYAASPGAFSEDRAEGLSLLVREVGTLLGTRRRLKRARAREMTQRTLAVALAAEVDVRQALESSLDAALESSGLDGGGVYLPDPRSGLFRLACWRGLSDTFVESVRTIPPGSPSMGIVREGNVVYATIGEKASPIMAAMGREGIRSLAVLPVVSGGGTVACMNLASKTSDTIPTEVRDALEAITFQIGPAIDRIRAQESLRQSEGLYHTTVDALAEWVHTVDSDFRILLINEAFRKIAGEFGLAPELVGKTVWEAFPFLPEKTHEEYRQVFETGRPHTGEETITLSGRTLRTRTRKIPVFEAGRVVRVITLVEDITQETRAGEERLRLESRMQQAQKFESLGILAGGVAHDFNNILAGIIGHCELALLDCPEGGRVRSRIQKVRAAAQRAADLTRQLLDCAGKGGRQVEPLDLNALLREMSELLEASISRRIHIAYELSDTLPAIEGDPTQLRQVVMNLILNAAESLGDLGGEISLRTLGTRVDLAGLAGGFLPGELEEGCYAVIEVQDSGCGMDAGTAAKIFDPFFTTKFAGRGLGLAAVLGIVRGHGGTIQVESVPGEGSTFRVFLRIGPTPPPAC